MPKKESNKNSAKTTKGDASSRFLKLEPDQLPVTALRAEYLAEIAKVDVKELKGKKIAEVHDVLKWRLEPELLAFRRVCGKVVKRDPVTGELIQGTIEDKTRQVCTNIQAIAEAAGAGIARVVKTTIFLTDLGHFSTVNDIYSQFFDTLPPARSTVQAAALPMDVPVVIEAIVCLGDSHDLTSI